MDLSNKLRAAKGLAQALAALHRMGICHGGLSARCVFIGDGSDEKQRGNVAVRVIEAGVAQALIDANMAGAHGRLVLGASSVRYLPPEAWTDPAAPASEADMWALGLLLLEIFGAGPPHPDCGSVQQISSKVLPHRGRRSSLPLRPDELAAPPLSILAQLVEQCLLQDKTKR